MNSTTRKLLTLPAFAVAAACQLYAWERCITWHMTTHTSWLWSSITFPVMLAVIIIEARYQREPRERRGFDVVPHASRAGFTLVEMIVVMAIMVIGMTLAVPAIRYLTGSKSHEAAENTITAYLSMVRSEAMGLQRVEGVMFLLNTATDRVECIPVMESPQQPTDFQPPQVPQGQPQPPAPVYLDAVPDHDPLPLPLKLRAWTMLDQPPAAYNLTPVFATRFLGFNDYGNPNIGEATAAHALDMPEPVGGVILFDGTGRIVSKPYGLRLLNHVAGAPTNLSPLGQILFAGSSNFTNEPTADWPAKGAALWYLPSQVGLVIADAEEFKNAIDNSFPADVVEDSNWSGADSAINNWLDNNATMIFVNRYDGSLMKAD